MLLSAYIFFHLYVYIYIEIYIYIRIYSVCVCVYCKKNVKDPILVTQHRDREIGQGNP